jgi:hypothetical protein
MLQNAKEHFLPLNNNNKLTHATFTLQEINPKNAKLTLYFYVFTAYNPYELSSLSWMSLSAETIFSSWT